MKTGEERDEKGEVTKRVREAHYHAGKPDDILDMVADMVTGAHERDRAAGRLLAAIAVPVQELLLDELQRGTKAQDVAAALLSGSIMFMCSYIEKTVDPVSDPDVIAFTNEYFARCFRDTLATVRASRAALQAERK